MKDIRSQACVHAISSRRVLVPLVLMANLLKRPARAPAHRMVKRPAAMARAQQPATLRRTPKPSTAIGKTNSKNAVKMWGDKYLHTLELKRVPRRHRPPLSCRALVYVTPKNTGANICLDNGFASLSICGAGVRAVALVSEIICTITLILLNPH